MYLMLFGSIPSRALPSLTKIFISKTFKRYVLLLFHLQFIVRLLGVYALVILLLNILENINAGVPDVEEYEFWSPRREGTRSPASLLQWNMVVDLPLSWERYHRGAPRPETRSPSFLSPGNTTCGLPLALESLEHNRRRPKRQGKASLACPLQENTITGLPVAREHDHRRPPARQHNRRRSLADRRPCL